MNKPEALAPIKRSPFKVRYGNFIGGNWVAPASGRYFNNLSPIDGKLICEVPNSDAIDVERALDAAHRARAAWGRTSAAERALLLNRVADRMQDHLQLLAEAETWDNGKPIRETLAADVPLAIDHFRYFAGCIRAQEGTIGDIAHEMVSYHFHEPLGVVGQIIPWNFPLLMAAWKLAPALAAGNCVVIKPSRNTPASILVFAELIADLLPPGVLNIVNGSGGDVGEALASSKRIAKIAFTGSTDVGRGIMHHAADSLIPVTLELGGKSPNVFFDDVMAADDNFLDKAIEGLALFAFNKGEVCSCPSRALVQESIFDRFMERATARVEKIRVGNPLDPATQMGPQNSSTQLDKVMRYIDVGFSEGAQLLTGGVRAKVGNELAGGYYLRPTMFRGDNSMRIFQEEIFGPVLAVTTFKDEAEALAIANDTIYGLGAGVWSRDANRCYRMARGIQAGRVWVNQYHAYPAHAAFGGYKQSGIGRETHKVMLDHYQQTKNMLVSYSSDALGLF
ncbi:MAG: Aldehyde Dehydrogenase [Hydrocarboniphaga sp.]|uniref:aldehyde dehydrogenase family protein n=1 Tax=Hydrocarboniphaga sp. TaxID=2033016 RepID=UPI00280DBE79|nr:Aldehyde Dehydrogenase [Hydrocarboniphaga sp.]